MGIPVVIVPSGGLPVTEATNGYGVPMTEATNGYGIPVTFVDIGGLPVVGIASGPPVPTILLSWNSVPENVAIGAIVGSLSVINGTGTYTFTLTNNAGGKFVLAGANNFSLRTAALLDYETASSHVIAVSATNGVDPIAPKNFTIIVTDTAVPVITSSATVSVAENATLAHALTADQGVTWALVAGGDQPRFALSGSTLQWLGNGTKNFDAPNDADLNNIYLVTVRATSTSTGEIADQAIAVTVTNVLEVTLNALTLDTNSIMTGSPENTLVGTLQGVSAGSTLSMTDTASGRFKLSGNTVVAGATATTSLVSHNITVRETHPDGNNSPRNSVISVTVIPFVVLPNAPVIAMSPLWDSSDPTPDFVMTFDSSVAAGDSLTTQIQVAGGSWSTLVKNSTHSITAPEDTADEVNLSLGPLANNNYEVRARVTNVVGSSAWSNIEPFTITGGTNGAATYYILGF